MQRFSCNLHSQDEFGILLLSLERWFLLSKSHWESCTAFHLYRSTGCRFNLPRHNRLPLSEAEHNFKFVLKTPLVNHICHRHAQNTRHQEASWGNNIVLWCHAFFKLRSPPSQSTWVIYLLTLIGWDGIHLWVLSHGGSTWRWTWLFVFISKEVVCFVGKEKICSYEFFILFL